MLSKVKALTLTVIAVCVFGAVAASGASAAEFHIAGMGTATGDGTQISGSPTEFSIPEGALKCPSAIFQVSTLANPSNVDVETSGQTATVNIQEGGTQTLACTFAGLAGTIVHMNGCNLRIHALLLPPAAQATVLCSGTNQIEVTAIVIGVTKCTIKIPTQTDKQSVTITNNASDVDLTSAVTGLNYQTTTGTGLGACTATAAGTDGQFKGKVTVQGTLGGGVASKIQYS